MKSSGFIVKTGNGSETYKDHKELRLQSAFVIPIGNRPEESEDGPAVITIPVKNGPGLNKGEVLTIPSVKPGKVAPLVDSKLLFPGFTGLDVPATKMVGRMSHEVKAVDKRAHVSQEGDCVIVTLSVDSSDDRVCGDIVCGVADAFVRALRSLLFDKERASEDHTLVYQVSGCRSFGCVYADPFAKLSSADRKGLRDKLKLSRRHLVDLRCLELQKNVEAKKGMCASLCGLIAISVDCEMVLGKFKKSMLARMSLVGMHRADPQQRVVLLDVYVKPECAVTNYLTHVNGITRHHIEDNPDALPFRVAQNIFLGVVAQDSSLLLVGHGLVNDLAALHVGHEELRCKVTDSATDPKCLRKNGNADSLRNLCEVHLQRNIQTDGMHCSVEDAWAALCLGFKLVELQHERDRWNGKELLPVFVE